MLSGRRQAGYRASLNSYPRHILFLLRAVLVGYKYNIAD
jgi:hypothetical protein